MCSRWVLFSGDFGTPWFMRVFICSAISMVVLAGCASWETENVPLPASTPFDSNPAARMAYLDAFRDGYRTATREGRISQDFITGPNRFARELGWRAGATQAISDKGAGTQAPGQ